MTKRKRPPLDMQMVKRHIRSELRAVDSIVRDVISGPYIEVIEECLIKYQNRYENYQTLLDLFESAVKNDKELKKCIHSVQTRMKSYTHVADKMIRRCFTYEKEKAENPDCQVSKDKSIITKETFFNPESGIADFAGVRILHLKKGDWRIIHKHLPKLSLEENIDLTWRRAYINKEKDREFYAEDQKRTEQGFLEFEIEMRDGGYTSLHYVFRDMERFQDKGDDLCIECQIRTVFDEGWGEISHELDYPHRGHSIYQGHLSVLSATTSAAIEITTALEVLQELPQFIPWEIEQKLCKPWGRASLGVCKPWGRPLRT